MVRVTALIALLFASVASAGKSLDDADQAYEGLAFDEAAPLYRKALEEPATREERIRAYRGLGLSEAFMGDAKAARAAFERLLLLDPAADVDLSLGPKISRPFEQARRAVRGKKTGLRVERDSRSGAITARLDEEIPLSSRLSLNVRARGAARWESVTVNATDPATLKTEPTSEIEAHAFALDEGRGVLYEAGTAAIPKLFPPVRRAEVPAAAAVAAVEDASVEESAPSPLRGKLPYVLGGAAAVVAAGVLGAVVLSQPRSVSLPAADRTSRLP